MSTSQILVRVQFLTIRTNKASRTVGSLEGIAGRDSQELLVASRRKPKRYEPSTLSYSPSLEAYFAGSAKWKVSLAPSSKVSNRRRCGEDTGLKVVSTAVQHGERLERVVQSDPQL